MSKMSEQKRVSLTTLSNTVSASGFGAGATTTASAAAASLRFGGDLGPPEKDKTSASAAASKGNNKTIRLKLELFQTDSCSYPEFNYSKLLHLQKKKLKKLKQKTNGFSDPFAENDDDVARIAKELEQKYGTGYAIGRGRSKKDDHCDIGLGYDESDSFIDNTEAYDEVIPEEVETVEGGFYINCGALEFKKLHTSTTTKTDEIIKMPNRPKKRVLSSSSEDSSSSDDDDDDKDDDDDGDSMEEATVAKTKPKSNTSGPAEKRLKNAATKSQENGTKKKDTTSSSNSPKPNVDELNSDSEKRQKLVKTTTVKDMLKAKRDSFLKMQVGTATNGEIKGAANKSSDDDSSSEESEDTANQSDSTAGAAAAPDKKFKGATVTEENSEKLRMTDTKLPELEADLVAGIQEFKEMVKSKSMSGKKFLFDDKLTEVFLRIDESLLCIDKTQRNMVFAHLEYFLQLPKYYFLRKAKQLRIKEEKNKSKRALGKLRKAIIETMPGAISNYEVELRKNVELASGNMNADQPPKMPKKKFPWNSNLRSLLYDVYQVRWTSYPVLGTRKETLESFINVYMKDKVVELWPNGWMRFEELQKEIEKRKQATKKAKEKKKDSLPSAATATTSAATASVQGAGAAAAAAAAAAASTTYIKQFEEFATSSSRSCANSDTDSVASSGAPINLKRKNAIDTNKQGKFKSMRNNGEQQPLVVIVDNIINNNNNSEANKKHQTNADIALDLISPSKRTDHSIHHIISNTPPPASSSSTATSTVTSQSLLQKHSKSVEATTTTTAGAHIIDLDNYKTASDIIQTSKQLMNATAIKNHQQRAAAAIPAHLLRRDSSSESDGVEIVGVFPAKPMPAQSKQKFRKMADNNQHRSNTPMNNIFMDAIAAANAQYAASVAASSSSTTTASAASTNSNNNNNNHINNKKPSLMLGSGSGGKLSKGIKLPEFDVSTVVKMLKDIEEAQQLKQKPTLTPQNASTKEPHQ